MKPQQQRQSQQNRHNYSSNNNKYNNKYSTKHNNNKSRKSRQVGWPIKRSRLNLEAGQVYVAQWA